VIRSGRERRQAQKSAANANESASNPHCPICNALMVKRLARRGHLSAANASSNPRRISATVQNRADTNYVSLDTVINRKGKAFTQPAMVSKNFGMNAAVDSQGVNVSQDGFAKIASEAGRLVFIESKPDD
jgi:hypothetical protein